MDNWMLWLFIIGAILSPLILSARTIWNILLGLRVPTTGISAIPSQGWVQIVGRIKGEPVKSWLNNSECAYWQLEVKEYQGGGRGGGRWKTVHKESSGPFEVDDMTGRINIQTTENTDLVLNNEAAIEKLDDPSRAKLESIGIKTKGFLGFKKKLRIYERLIAPGEEILVLGKFQKNPEMISISGGSITPSIISNLSKGEMLKTYSWRTARPLIIPYLFSIAFVAFLIVTMFLN
jgi:hypothetical protein